MLSEIFTLEEETGWIDSVCMKPEDLENGAEVIAPWAQVYEEDE